tara:strand:- start:59 stop:298 length:240 start_codon:yes stop_codon:yes gene_type:complete
LKRPIYLKGIPMIIKNLTTISNIVVNVTLISVFSIGKNCIIGACSQVRHNICDNEIWYGNPAKYFKIINFGKVAIASMP